MTTADVTQSPSEGGALRLRYAGVSCYEATAEAQRLCLFTDQRRAGEGGALPTAALTLRRPLAFREGLRTLLELAGLRGAYQPVDAEVYQAYAAWRRGLDPMITPVETTRAFFAFLAEHDPTAWVGCDPTVSLSPNGLSFELLEPEGRVYGALTLKASAYEAAAGSATHLCAQVEGGVSLRDGLARLNSATPATLHLGAAPTLAAPGCAGEVEKALPAPLNWQRGYTQLLAATTLSPRRVPLSRMDLYNILQQLRLNADPAKSKTGMRFELVPGRAPSVTLEPWGWRLTGTGGAYRGPRAELIGVWDRRDLIVFDALLPYVQGVEAVILGEAQPTFWVLDCGDFTFTLGVMGFRPNNWSRGLLLDVTLPRPAAPQEGTQTSDTLSTLDARALSALSAHQSAPYSAPHTATTLAAALSVTREEAQGALRRLVQGGAARPHMAPGSSEASFEARELFQGFTAEASRYRNEREALAHALISEGRVRPTISELPTGEVEVQGAVTEPKAAHMASEPTYAPQFQLKEGAGMRKVSCDCAWMKDREKQKVGPCAHVQALWLRYALDEAARAAELAAHPERVERASKVFVRRDGEVEKSRVITLKRTRLEEVWEDTGATPRRLHKVFNTVAAARAAYFQRVADLERRQYMDASVSS